MTPAQITAWRRLASAVAYAGRAETLARREIAAKRIARTLRTTWRWRAAPAPALVTVRGLGQGYLAMDGERRMANRQALQNAARAAWLILDQIEKTGTATEMPLRAYRADIDG